MSNFPNSLDDDILLPRVENNITEEGGAAINALRDSTFAIEANIGTNAQGSAASISARLGVSLDATGHILSSALVGIGLVSLPITDAQIGVSAAIQESKLNLTYSTSSLNTLISTLNGQVSVINNFITLTGMKLAPHIAGTGYNHNLSAINVDSSPVLYKTNPVANVASVGTAVVGRNTTNSFTLAQDISNDLVEHEKADGTTVLPNSGGTVPPQNFAHVAEGIYIDSSNFSIVPQSNTSLQQFVEFVDNSSLLLLGSRTQTFYDNGIPRTARSSSLVADGYGQALVSPTPATAYLLDQPSFGGSTNPVDDINHGDDIVLFKPTGTPLSNNTFDAQFAQVSPGDLLTINYGNGTPTVSFIIDTVKSFINGGSRTYAVRINGRNLFASLGDGYSSARIDKSLFNRNKYGVLSLAQANNTFNELPSAIVAQPRSAQALGLGFNQDSFDSLHYNLYLVLYPDGNPVNKTIQLPAIDITGNAGITPGKYTLESIIASTNDAVRKNGYNFRFTAFTFDGEYGIMLNDPYNNASFSIVSGAVDGYGNYINSSGLYPNNVIDNFNETDPLGFGVNGSNAASPLYTLSYLSPLAAQVPTVILSPLKKNFYYVNGAETDRVKADVNTILDTYGDAFWPATITNVNVLADRIEVTYKVTLDLTQSLIKNGKTIVVQPAIPVTSGSYNLVDYGRFTIDNVSFNNCPGPLAYTTITVRDGIHGTGVSPYLSSTNISVNLYFCGDSVGFDSENASDTNGISPFKRLFEILVDQNGHTYSHERARLNISGSTMVVDAVNSFNLLGPSELAYINLFSVSPKLKGYSFSTYKKITLHMTDYNITTGIFDGYLCRFDGSSYSNVGQSVSGKKGEVTRFYNDTNIDYIDFIFNLDDSVPVITNKNIDIQLFPSLSLDKEQMLIGTCQFNDSTKKLSYLNDMRQFGNTSEDQFSDSALDFINANDKALRENGVIKGFDLGTSETVNVIELSGGTALIGGKIIEMNQSETTIPAIQETLYPAFTATINTITWFLCVNAKEEIELVASTDFATSMTGTYGSLDHNRIFYVKNPNALSPTAYAIRGSYLSNIVLKMKDLVPLYTVTATLSGVPLAVTSATALDIRRFVSGGYNGLADPFTLGSNASFRTFDSLNNYLTSLNKNISNLNVLSNKISDTVLVKDIIDISGKSVNTGNKIKFVGDGGKFVANTSSFMTNISLNNIRLEVNNVVGNTGIDFDGYLNTINDCTIVYTGGSPIDGYTIYINNNSSVIITGNRFLGPLVTAHILNMSGNKIPITGNIYKKTGSTALIFGGTPWPSTPDNYNANDG